MNKMKENEFSNENIKGALFHYAHFCGDYENYIRIIFFLK